MKKFIIFVHGLGGKVNKTWGNFPKFITDDDDIEHEVREYGYTSTTVDDDSLWKSIKEIFRSAPTILNIANGLLTYIKTHRDIENDEIILVGHSMGGLVIKRLSPLG